MMFGPLARISPSPAISTSTPGIGLPTVPIFTASWLLTEITGEVSERP